MATIIKTGRRVAAGGTPGLSSFNFADMSDQANDYLQQVRGQAARIIERAQQEAEQIRQQAIQEGADQAHRTAIDQARQDLHNQLQTALPALREFVTQLQSTRQEWLRNWENNAIRLSAAIATRIARREAQRDPQVTLGLIREALELAAGSGEITLQLNPDDYETLRSDLESLQRELGNLAPTSIVPDPHVSAAGCRVQTQFGTIDQQLEAQAARIEEELRT